MSSHSSDVYVMEDEEELSVQMPEGLVDSHSTTPLESSAEELYSRKKTTCALRTVGTNTENYVEESVNSLLYNGIMELMRTVAGDGFSDNVSMKFQQQRKHSSEKEIVMIKRNLIKRLGDIVADHSQSCRLPESSLDVTDTAISVPVSTTNTTINTTEISAVPSWVAELQESMSVTEALLHELTKTTENKETLDTSRKSSTILLGPPVTLATPSHSPLSSPPPPPPVVSSLIPPENTSRTEELEAELRKLHETTTEMRLILAKEGLDSVIPLYNELLELRELRRKTALKDAETTMAYLTTMECCFKQQLIAAEKSKRCLDLELTRRSCDIGNTIATLVEDVEKLAQLSRDLKVLRSEYQRQVGLVDKNHYLSIDPVPGEKRPRTSEGSFKLLFEQQLEKEQQIQKLRQELESQKKETTEWRERYELSVQSTSLVRENTTFNSLLRNVDERLSTEANRKIAFLCHIFGWNLLGLTDKSIVIARIGCAEEKLTLSFDSLKDENSALAMSIVLAKKVLENCSNRREQQEYVQSDKDNEEDLDDEGKMDDNEENKPTIKEVKDLELEEMDKTEVENEIYDTGKEEVYAIDFSTDKNKEESTVKETPSSDSAEPAFYSGGLWDE
ncbi:hypothetical protein LSM04_003593 [Trypanosoma melophagium]|uniref:uncharacterized protein n=1 Tax=Trypanosoma melophagium TaxID=715481 RepID=UPI00351AAA02|nr:hypothetical protein LSM04_003593 [Trypanosoma melophagium]